MTGEEFNSGGRTLFRCAAGTYAQMSTEMTERDRAPIVLLHGATASARVWDPLLPALGEQYRVLAPTLAGHRGGPSIPSGPTGVVQRIVDALCRQLDDVGVETAHLAGNSLGGWVALELARRGRARSVLAFSPAGAWRSQRDLIRLLTVFRVGAVLARVKGLPKIAERKRVRRILFAFMAEHADRMTLGQTEATFGDIEGCVALPEIIRGAASNGAMQLLPSGVCPVRIAWGLNDRMLPFMRYGAPMLLGLPGAEFEFLPDVGHVPMIDDPVLVADTILEFVNRIDSN